MCGGAVRRRRADGQITDKMHDARATSAPQNLNLGQQYFEVLSF
jgi:hypothetical protein